MSESHPARLIATLAFAYDRALAPLLWALACIMLVELAVAHLIVSSLVGGAAAMILSALSIATLVWIIFFIRSLKRRPVLVDETGVTMRVGSLRSVEIPMDRIGGVRTSWPREALKQRSVLNLALINYPNVMVDLDPPLPARRRSLTAVTHRLDDPGGFVAAVARLARRASGEE